MLCFNENISAGCPSVSKNTSLWRISTRLEERTSFCLEGCLLVVTSEELHPASESEKNGHVALQHHHQWLLATYTRNNPVVALDRMDSHERERVVYWYSIQFCMLVKDGLMSFVERSVFCPGTRPSSNT